MLQSNIDPKNTSDVEKSILLLNSIMKPCDSVSSTVLHHDGNVGGFDDLIKFLFKAKIKEDIKIKLTEVYKIFN